MKIEKRLKYFKNELWFLNKENIWTNANELWDDKTILKRVMGNKIKAWHYAEGRKMLVDLSKSKKTELSPTGYFMTYMNDVWENATIEVEDNILASFSNGWLDLQMNWHADEFPFNPSQIPFEYNQMPTVVTEVDEYLDWMTAGDDNRKKALLAGMASTLMRRNDSLMLIMYSKLGGTGKTQLGSLFKKIAKKSILRIKTENVFGRSAEGNKFAITGIKHKTGILGEELPTNLNQAATDLIKDMIDEGKAEIATEDKGKNAEETNNIVTMAVSTNRISNWYDVDNALKTRVSVVMVKSDLNKIPVIAQTENFRAKIYNDTKALQYVLSLAVNAYLEAKKGWRAEGFRFGTTDSTDYWKLVETADSIVLDFAEYGLDDFLDKRTSNFLSNEKIEQWYVQWKAQNFSSKVTSLAMKKKMKQYIEATLALDVELGATRRINGKSTRGIIIRSDVPWDEEGEE